MHYVTVNSILSSKNGMNIYRGCSHGCIYCDSRSDIYNMNHDFEDIEVKENSIELLKKALKKKKEKCMIATGAMSDPYIPQEKTLKYTRKALELVEKLGFGFTCITKSDLVLRDIDIFKKINNKSKAVLQMTITTADEELCKILEPNVCTTKKRVKVLKKFNKAGVPTVVWLCPILPYINDTEENIRAILDYCVECNVYGIICFGMELTLRDGDRQYFYKQLDKHFPGLKKTYIKEFKNSYALPSPQNDELMRIFYDVTSKNNIENSSEKIFKYLGEFPQDNKTFQSKLF